MNTKVSKALTLVGPTRENLVYSPLAGLNLKNQLYIKTNLNNFKPESRYSKLETGPNQFYFLQDCLQANGGWQEASHAQASLL